MAREFEIIAAIRPYLDGDGEGVPMGTDDDAAVVAVGDTPVAVAVDTLVDAHHFDRTISSLGDVGWKALAVNVSDLVAVGARPVAAVVSLQRPPAFTTADAEDLYAGMRAAADAMGSLLVGGDTVNASALAVSVTVLGAPLDPQWTLRRSTARPGDVVVVVGQLGLAAAGLALARAGATDLLDARPELLAAHRRPVPQLAALGALYDTPVTAAIDVSDGLGRDLAHIARGSRCDLDVAARELPVDEGVAAAAARLRADPLDFVVGGGDDYAIAATVGSDDLAALAAALRAAGVPLAVVGEVRGGAGRVRLHTPRGVRDISSDGWEHE